MKSDYGKDVYNSTNAFERLLGRPSKAFRNIVIAEDQLSVRVYNRLKFRRIQTVEQLLQTNPASLMEIRGFGKQCVDEILDYLSHIQPIEPETSFKNDDPITEYLQPTEPATSIKNDNPITEHLQYTEPATSIKNEDLITEYQARNRPITTQHFRVSEITAKLIREQFQKNLLSKPNEKPTIIDNNAETQYWLRQLAYEDKQINIDLMLDILAESEKNPKIEQLCEDIIQGITLQKKIRAALEKLPENIWNHYAHNYLALYNQSSQRLKTLKQIYKGEDDTLYAALHSKYVTEENLPSLENFLAVCAVPPQTILDDIFNKMKWPEYYPDVLKLRAEGKTLRETGDYYQVSRERIRQLEKKLIDQFARKERKHKL